jgi:hypothetical protein
VAGNSSLFQKLSNDAHIVDGGKRLHTRTR